MHFEAPGQCHYTYLDRDASRYAEKPVIEIAAGSGSCDALNPERASGGEGRAYRAVRAWEREAHRISVPLSRRTSEIQMTVPRLYKVVGSSMCAVSIIGD